MPLKVFVGWDERDVDAYRVCVHSLLRQSTIDLEIIPLVHWRLRNDGIYWRGLTADGKGQKFDDKDGRPFSTDFAFTRFLVPYLAGYKSEKVVFVDADWLWRGDIRLMLDECTGDKALWCVNHNHVPLEHEKMGGLSQGRYKRKNWSSLMVMNPAKNDYLTKYMVNTQHGTHLHQLCWLKDEEIGELNEAWNWLEGWSDPEIDPWGVHFTRGTPDLPGCENVMFADEWQAELKMVGSALCADPAS